MENNLRIGSCHQHRDASAAWDTTNPNLVREAMPLSDDTAGTVNGLRGVQRLGGAEVRGDLEHAPMSEHHRPDRHDDLPRNGRHGARQAPGPSAAPRSVPAAESGGPGRAAITFVSDMAATILHCAATGVRERARADLPQRLRECDRLGRSEVQRTAVQSGSHLDRTTGHRQSSARPSWREVGPQGTASTSHSPRQSRSRRASTCTVW